MARIIATPVLIYLALTDREDADKWQLLAGLSILGKLEELIIIALLPNRTSDVRGLYWVLERREADAA